MTRSRTTRTEKQRTSPSRRSSRVPLIAGAVVVAGAALVAVLTAPGSAPAVGPVSAPASAATAAVTLEGAALPVLGRGADAALGRAAPVVRGTDPSGDPVTVGGGGTPQAVVFLAHWCPHCQREVPALQAWLDARAAPEGVELVSVSTAEDPTAPNHPPAAWLEREGWTLPVLVDEGSAAADAYGLSGLPFFVFLDADGRVVQRRAGELTPDQLGGVLDDLRDAPRAAGG